MNDGSGPELLQVIMPKEVVAECPDVTFGSCVSVDGMLVESPAKGQRFEFLSSKVEVLGPCNPLVRTFKQFIFHFQLKKLNQIFIIF